MKIIQLSHINEPSVGDYCVTTDGHIVQLKQYKGSWEDIYSYYDYEYITPYPHDVRDVCISTNDLIVALRDCNESDVRNQYPEYFV